MIRANKLLAIILSPLTLIRLVLIIFNFIILLPFAHFELWIFKKKGSYKFRIIKLWGKISLLILGFIIKRNKIPKMKEYILMPNHQSYLDVLLIGTYSSSAFVAKKEIMNWPITRVILDICKLITVDRKDIRSLNETMMNIKKSIENKIPVTVFPEGTTHKGPGTLPFKKGSFKIATEIGVPIIPCVINYFNSGNKWKSSEPIIIHFFRQMWRPFQIVELKFFDPMISDDYLKLRNEVYMKINNQLINKKGNSY